MKEDFLTGEALDHVLEAQANDEKRVEQLPGGLVATGDTVNGQSCCIMCALYVLCVSVWNIVVCVCCVWNIVCCVCVCGI